MNVARRYPRFRRLLASLAVSQAGDWLYNLALLAFVYERTHSSTWLAITTAARVLPVVVFGPLGGVVADRYDRRRLMLASDGVRFVLMLALAGVAAAGLPVALAPLIAALSTAAASVYIPCVAATTPRLVDDGDLPAANAVRSAIQHDRRAPVGRALERRAESGQLALAPHEVRTRDPLGQLPRPPTARVYDDFVDVRWKSGPRSCGLGRR